MGPSQGTARFRLVPRHAPSFRPVQAVTTLPHAKLVPATEDGLSQGPRNPPVDVDIPIKVAALDTAKPRTSVPKNPLPVETKIRTVMVHVHTQRALRAPATAQVPMLRLVVQGPATGFMRRTKEITLVTALAIPETRL